DHRAKGEAAEITEIAHREGLEAIQWCGGVYSSEWGFSKLLHWLRHNPSERAEFVSAFEHCDMVAATLCGINDPKKVKRSVCAMDTSGCGIVNWAAFRRRAFSQKS